MLIGAIVRQIVLRVYELAQCGVEDLGFRLVHVRELGERLHVLQYLHAAEAPIVAVEDLVTANTKLLKILSNNRFHRALLFL